MSTPDFVPTLTPIKSFLFQKEEDDLTERIEVVLTVCNWSPEPYAVYGVNTMMGQPYHSTSFNTKEEAERVYHVHHRFAEVSVRRLMGVGKIYDSMLMASFEKWYTKDFMAHVRGDEGSKSTEQILKDLQQMLHV